jgi:hypothetical protein
VAAQFAGDAVGLNVEYDDNAIVLGRNQSPSRAKAQKSRTRPEARKSPRWLKRMQVEWPLPTRCDCERRVGITMWCL